MAARKQLDWLPRRGALRAAVYALLCALVLLVAANARLLNVAGIDSLLERQLLSIASHTVGRSTGESMRLIYIDEKDNATLDAFAGVEQRQCFRRHHAVLLHKLKAAGAKVVAFDLVFPPTIKSCAKQNEEFLAALREVRRDGEMQVVLGYDAASDYDRDIAALIPVNDTGLVRTGRLQRGESGASFLTGALLAEADETSDAGSTTLTRPMPLPLVMYLADQRRWPANFLPAVFPGERRLTFPPAGKPLAPITIDVRSCNSHELNCPLAAGASRHWYALLPVWMGEGVEFIERSYASVVLQETLSTDYAGKIVLIGARTADDLVALDEQSSAGRVWGYQVHARTLADLLSGTYLRRPTLLVVFLFLIGLVTLGVVAQRWLPRMEIRISLPWLGSYPIPLGLVLMGGLHGFALILLLRNGYWLHDVGYQWLALAAGFYLASRPIQPIGSEGGKS